MPNACMLIDRFKLGKKINKLSFSQTRVDCENDLTNSS